VSHQDHYRRLVHIYAHAPINAFYAPTIAIAAGTAQLAIPLRPEFHHTAGAVHGSVYFKAMDDAAYFAVNSLVEDVFVLTVSFTVNLMRPIVDGEVRASGKVTGHGGNLFFAESTLTDHHDRVVGHGSGVFTRSTIPLPTLDAQGHELAGQIQHPKP
jgi:uncharacterized protein (TIGR00369 family)